MRTPNHKSAHIGRNISKLRELRGLKQEALAQALGLTQQAISNIENSEIIEDTRLDDVANALGFPPEVIKNFNEDSLINILSNTFNDSSVHSDNSSSCNSSINIEPSFGSVEKIIEIYQEKERLYERLLEAEKEKSALLERLLDRR
jgi:Predicted transcriptional regulators